MTDVNIGTRLRNNDGIQITPEIEKQFPAVFNCRRSTNVSEEYQIYHSHEIIDQMEGAGMKLVEMAQEKLGRSRKRAEHTQIHALRFRSKQLDGDFGIGDSIPEIMIMNNHDGRFRFRAHAGIFRLACANGMVVFDENMGSAEIRHYGKNNTFDAVKQIIAEFPEKAEAVSEGIRHWSDFTLDKQLQLKLAQALMLQRQAPTWLKREQALEAKRDVDQVDADGNRSLWLTFNVLQENLTNSIVAKAVGEEEGAVRRSAIRPIGGTVTNYNLNKRLWKVTSDFKELVESPPKPKISEMTGQELLSFFNQHAPTVGVLPRKSHFRNRKQAETMVKELITL